MKRTFYVIIMCIMILIPAIIAGAQSKQGFTVAGEIHFSKTGKLFVQIVTEEEFNNTRQRKTQQENTQHESEDASPFQLMLSPDEDALQQKTIAFSFDNVPAGRYTIRCFQDVNGNGKLDGGMFGPKEPWGFYRPKRPKFRGPKFDEVAFDVKQDMTHITFEVK